MKRLIIAIIILCPIVLFILLCVFEKNISRSINPNDLQSEVVKYCIDQYFDIAKYFVTLSMTLIGITWAYIIQIDKKIIWWNSFLFANIISGAISIWYYLQLSKNIITNGLVNNIIEIQAPLNSFYHDWQINYVLLQLILVTAFVSFHYRDKVKCGKI